MSRAPYDWELDQRQSIGMPPYDDEPDTGSCWNCGHACNVLLGRKLYDLCALKRDDGTHGELEFCDPSIRDCESWEEA